MGFLILSFMLILQIIFCYPLYKMNIKALEARKPKFTRFQVMLPRVIALASIGMVIFGVLVLLRGHHSMWGSVPSDQAGLGFVLLGLNFFIFSTVAAQSAAHFFTRSPR